MQKEVLTLWEFGYYNHRNDRNTSLADLYRKHRPSTVEDAFFAASINDRIYDFNIFKSIASDCAAYCTYFKKLQADVRNSYFSLKAAERMACVGYPIISNAKKRAYNELEFQRPHLIPFNGDIPFTFDEQSLSDSYIYNSNLHPDNRVLLYACDVFRNESDTLSDIFDHELSCIGSLTADPAVVFSPYRSMRELNSMPELKAFRSYIEMVFDKSPYTASVHVIPSVYLVKAGRDFENALDDPWQKALDGDLYGSVAIALCRKCIDDEAYGFSFFYWLLKSENYVACKYRREVLEYLSSVALAEINYDTPGKPHVPQNSRGIIDYCASLNAEKGIRSEYRLYKNEIFKLRSGETGIHKEPPLPKRAGTIRQLMWKSLSHTCSLCGKHIESIRDMHVDHIIPLAKGGSDTVDNMQLLHKACNLSKGAKVVTDYQCGGPLA